MRYLLSVSTLLLLGGAAGASMDGLEAQQVSDVHGRVLEFRSDSPVAAVRVELLDERGRNVAATASDERGAFRFAGVRAGNYRLRASSLGYSPVTTPAVVVAGDTVHLVIRIGIDAVPLAPLEVVTRPQPLHRHPGLAAFAERAQKRLGGAFLLREEVEERQPRNLTDLLRLTGSMTVMDHARGGTVFNMRTQCAPAVYIDGRFIAGHEGGVGGGGERVFEAINSVHWGEVEGIEIYSGVSTVPAEFSGSRAGCGIVAIWLRRG